MPPSTLRVCVVDHGEKKVRLRLPVILLWPFAGLLIPVYWAAGAIVWLVYRRSEMFRLFPAITALICGLRGLRVSVRNDATGTRVLVGID